MSKHLLEFNLITTETLFRVFKWHGEIKNKPKLIGVLEILAAFGEAMAIVLVTEIHKLALHQV